MSAFPRWRLLGALALVVVVAASIGVYLLASMPGTSPTVSPTVLTTAVQSSVTSTSVITTGSRSLTTTAFSSQPVEWIRISDVKPMGYYLSLLESNRTEAYVQLARELSKLPDLVNATAVAKITYLALNATNPEVKEAFELLMTENLQRQDFNPVEIATLLKHATEQLGYSQRQLANKIGKDAAWVNRHLKLLELPQPVQSMLTRGNGLTEGHTRHMLALTGEEQIQVANAVAQQKLTTRETEMLIRRLRIEASPRNRVVSREPRLQPNNQTNDLEPTRWKEYSQHHYLQFYSVWPVTRRHDPFFGVNGTIYSGCCPLIVPVNCILRYTKQNELVLDPFVGSGTTLVACAMLKRLGVGVDINPEAQVATEKRFKVVSEKDPSLVDWLGRQRFIQADSRDLSFIQDSSIDLIFSHPPYLDMMDYGEKGTYSDTKEYGRFLQDSLIEMYRVLKPTRFCCVQIGPYAAKHLPLHHIAHELALKAGFEFVDEVVLAFLADYVGYSSSVSGRDTSIVHKEAFAKWFSIAHNVYHHNHEYLIILRKPA